MTSLGSAVVKGCQRYSAELAGPLAQHVDAC